MQVSSNNPQIHKNDYSSLVTSVSDPLHIDADPLPVLDPARTNSNFFSSQFFSVKGLKLITKFFVVVILSLLFAYIKLNK